MSLDARPSRHPTGARRAARDGARRELILGRRLVRVAGVAGLVAVLALGVMGVVVRELGKGLPSVQDLAEGYNPPQVSRIVASDGTLLATEFTERRTVVPFDQIADATKLAFLAAEDARFYEHGGLSYRGLWRAFWADVRAFGFVQGGSTITQQVAEDVLLGHSRKPAQKIRETLLAFRLEAELSKDEILGLYMNNIFLGHGRYGIEEAARFYFGKRALELDVAESALIAGIIASPERYSPRRAPERALARRRYVLGQMLAKGFITREYHARVVDAPLVLGPLPRAEDTLAPEAVQIARRELRRLADERPERGGYTVQTTIDPELQRAARAAVRDALSAYAERHRLAPPYVAQRVRAWGAPFVGAPRPNKTYVGVVRALDDVAGAVTVQVGDITGVIDLPREDRYNPDHLGPSEFTRVGALLRVRLTALPDGEQPARLRLELGPQGALVALDIRTRHVVAAVGSHEGVPGGFDRARARRQPGSAFKPLVYAAAFEQRRVSPATVLELARRGPGVLDAQAPYTISVRDSLAHSNNDAAVALLLATGPARTVELAARLGISSTLGADASLALGAYEVSPLELANAYAVFASGGLRKEPRWVSSIAGPRGVPLEPPPEPEPERVMSAEAAYLVTSVMRSAVEAGTARAAHALGRPIAAKTGTTNDARDAWFVGYSTELCAAVWIGFDDASPLGELESGAHTASRAFVDFMRAAHVARPVTDFPRPPGILVVNVDRRTGLLPVPDQGDAISEEFLDGMAPELTAAALP